MNIYRLLTHQGFNSSAIIWADIDCIYARTSKISRLLTLFSYSKSVIVDRSKKHIEISKVYFWFYKSKKFIKFSDIEYIDVAKTEIVNKSEFGFDGRYPTTIYDVLLRKKSAPFQFNLFSFTDEGIWNFGGFFSTLFGNSVIDSEGSQQKKADHYAELISDYIGVKLWKNRNVQLHFDSGLTSECTKCGHLISLTAKACMYCGYEVS